MFLLSRPNSPHSFNHSTMDYQTLTPPLICIYLEMEEKVALSVSACRQNGSFAPLCVMRSVLLQIKYIAINKAVHLSFIHSSKPVIQHADPDTPSSSRCASSNRCQIRWLPTQFIVYCLQKLIAIIWSQSRLQYFKINSEFTDRIDTFCRNTAGYVPLKIVFNVIRLLVSSNI